MSRIPQNFIDDLLNRLDIVEVVDHRVKLKKSGKNYSACCPFHEEKTPSFTVSPDKQFYYCFGCGATGNAIGFLMEYERQGFVDAVESLAKTAGLEVPKEQQNEKQLERESRSKALYKVLEKANNYYQQQLREHPHRHRAVQYLKNRGLSGQIAKGFGIGYAPPGWDNLLQKLGLSEGEIHILVESGLVIHKQEESKTYDRFRDRIMFPIKDTRGRVIGFGGRVLNNEKPKYLNSPETPVFQKGSELYGLYEARQSKHSPESLVVVEGYMDVIALAQYDINNAVATLGTACGEEHLKLAFRYVSEVVFCFDGDNAGRTAAKRALLASLSAMEDGRQIRFLFLPEGQDPDSLVRQIGQDRFLAQIKSALPLEDFLFDVAAENLDISSMEGRARFSKIAAPLLNKLPNGVYRELMFSNLAKRTGLERDVLQELTQEKIKLEIEEVGDETAGPEDPQGQTHPSSNPETSTVTAIPRSAVRLNPVLSATILLLDNPELAAESSPHLQRFEHADADTQRLYTLLDYIDSRPNCNFNSIIGFWGAKFGTESMRELSGLVANPFMGSSKNQPSYDSQKELEAAFSKINAHYRKQQNQRELAELNSLGPKNLSEDQKQRLKELTRAVVIKSPT